MYRTYRRHCITTEISPEWLEPSSEEATRQKWLQGDQVNATGVRIATVTARDPRFARYCAGAAGTPSPQTSPPITATHTPSNETDIKNALETSISLRDSRRYIISPERKICRKQEDVIDVVAESEPLALNKRPSTETIQGKAKKSKIDRFVMLYSTCKSIDVNIQQQLKREDFPRILDKRYSPSLPCPEKLSSDNKSKPILEKSGYDDVNKLFAKLVATGILQVPKLVKEEEVKDPEKRENTTLEQLSTEVSKVSTAAPRNFMQHNHHPLCFQDIEALPVKAKEAEKAAEKVKQTESGRKVEIKDKSVAEVIETDLVDIDKGDEDDVICIAPQIEEVTVDDDDTNDETPDTKIDFLEVKIKQEPVDPDDEPVVIATDKKIQQYIDITQTDCHISIDGNDQPISPPIVVPTKGIRITISKPVPVQVINNCKVLEEVHTEDVHVPPKYKLKPGLEGVHFKEQPPVRGNSETSAMCSIM